VTVNLLPKVVSIGVSEVTYFAFGCLTDLLHALSLPIEDIGLGGL